MLRAKGFQRHVVANQFHTCSLSAARSPEWLVFDLALDLTLDFALDFALGPMKPARHPRTPREPAADVGFGFTQPSTVKV